MKAILRGVGIGLIASALVPQYMDRVALIIGLALLSSSFEVA